MAEKKKEIKQDNEIYNELKQIIDGYMKLRVENPFLAGDIYRQIIYLSQDTSRTTAN